jgi:hypothetical protein
MAKDLQVSDVFWDVAWDTGQLLVGAVHDGPLTAALLGAHEVHEALAAEAAEVVLGAWAGQRGGVSITGVPPRGPRFWVVGVEVSWEVYVWGVK